MFYFILKKEAQVMITTSISFESYLTFYSKQKKVFRDRIYTLLVVSAQSKRRFVLWASASFLAELSVESPRKLFVFII